VKTEHKESSDFAGTDKESLVRNLSEIVTDANELLKEVVSASSEEFSVAYGGVENRMNEAKARLDNVRVVISDGAHCAAHATSKFIIENPLKSLGIFAILGFVTGILIQRR